ncbi:MAG TPA: hypothetical protein DCL54_06205 [Alphaproteobacteria bacterium]|nr:hypothetical protein [Alphaproteobacteria bacterium]HAJ46155.1 hypothetical protein [Alphaproteobacteria bacterium]
MIVDISTKLDCARARAWEEVQKPALLVHVAKPLLVFKPLEPKTLPSVWREGRYRVSLWFLGLLPLGRQWVDVSKPAPPEWADQAALCIRDNGSGDLVRTWDHWIVMTDEGAGQTGYRDRVDIRAGLLTPFVWLFAIWFYHHRQARWRALVRRGFQP